MNDDQIPHIKTCPIKAESRQHMLSLSELIFPPPLACVTSHAISVADKSASDMAAAVLGVSSSWE